MQVRWSVYSMYSHAWADQENFSSWCLGECLFLFKSIFFNWNLYVFESPPPPTSFRSPHNIYTVVSYELCLPDSIYIYMYLYGNSTCIIRYWRATSSRKILFFASVLLCYFSYIILSVLIKWCKSVTKL